jgi:hypothetical protein
MNDYMRARCYFFNKKTILANKQDKYTHTKKEEQEENKYE